jgi:hypothetical protein
MQIMVKIYLGNVLMLYLIKEVIGGIVTISPNSVRVTWSVRSIP